MKNEKTKHVYRERNILSRMEHPNIIERFGTFTDHVQLYFVFDIATHGDMAHLLKKVGGPLDPLLARHYAA